MMKRMVQILLVIAMCFMSLAGFSGCGKSSKIDADGNITLEFWSIYPEGDPNHTWMQEKVNAFMAANPKVKINHTGTSFWDYFTKITISQTDVNGPDVFIQTVTDNGLRANGGISLEITEYLNASDKLSTSDFSESDRNALTHNNKVYGLPYATDGRVLYYNKDLVNELKTSTDTDWTQNGGMAKPVDLIDANGDVRAPKTFDELFAYTKLLTKTSDGTPNGNITQLGFSPKLGNNNIMNFAWNMGGEFFNGDTPIVDSDPKVRQAYETWKKIANAYPVAKVNSFVDSGADVSNTSNLFWTGKVALMIETNEIPWKNDMLAEADRINLGAASLPYTNEQYRTNFSGGFSLEITARLAKEDKRVIQAAYDFAQYMMSDEVQIEVLTKTANMPGKITIYDTLDEMIDDPVKRFVINEMNYRRPYNFVQKAPQWWAPVYESLNDYVSSNKTLDEALASAQKGIENIIRIS